MNFLLYYYFYFSFLFVVFNSNYTVVFNFAKEFLLHIYDNSYENEVYDFIVVGAGTAGSVVASRLSEEGSFKVLLLEAGGSSSALQDVPAYTGFFQKTAHDWQYRTLPQKHAGLGLDGRVSHWPRGKTLGGTSALNYMQYFRGHRSDYDGWSEGGATGWDYERILPYFKKSERLARGSPGDDGFHGRDGPVAVTQAAFSTPLDQVFLESCRELGYGIGDVNGKLQDEGFSLSPTTTDQGLRVNVYDAFVSPFLRTRNNLAVLSHAVVRRVLFSGKKAIGVEVERFGKSFRLSTRKEVILSAGTIGSAQILMLSGIGKKDDLSMLNISLVSDLPVGDNLQDHLVVPTFLNTKRSLAFPFKDLLSPNTYREYLSHKSGALLSPGGLSSFGVIKSDLGNNSTRPDLQINMVSFSIFSDFGLRITQNIGMSNEILDRFDHLVWSNNSTAMLLPCLLHPRSRGTIRLASGDPDDHPLIDPKYLSHERDVRTLVEGLKFARKLVNTTAFQRNDVEILEIPLRGCEGLDVGSTEYLTCYAKHLTLTLYHPVGTCKMGSAEDPTTVVDENLLVKGVHSLRVIDASVMPTIPGGNTNAPTLMVAEKGANLVKESWVKISNDISYSRKELTKSRENYEENTCKVMQPVVFQL